MQVGVSSYLPKNSSYFDYKSKSSIIELMSDSDLIITHGGYGTMMDAVGMRKKVIAVPRKAELGECLDDQGELVRYFDEKNYVKACYDMKRLPELVNLCLQAEFRFLSMSLKAI
jgi:UDP-N-acetylglucosamine transferase subunit ALG13